MRALIVDDSRALRAKMSGTLAKAGFQVLEAAGGPAALRVLEGHAPMDLVLVDWDLPEAGGLRFVLDFRSTPRFGTARMIMLITQPSTAELLEAIQFGVDDCLLKPFRPAQLLQKLAQLRLVAARETREETP